MDEAFNNKIKEYYVQYKKFESDEKFQEGIDVMVKEIEWLRGYLANMKIQNLDRLEVQTVIRDLSVLKLGYEIRRDMKNPEEKFRADFNNLTARVKKLEERMDELDRLK